MGDAGGSMFLFFLIVIVLYIAGMSIYVLVDKIKGRKKGNKADG